MFPLTYNYLQMRVLSATAADLRRSEARLKLHRARVRVLMEWSRGELEDEAYFWISRVIDAKFEALK